MIYIYIYRISYIMYIYIYHISYIIYHISYTYISYTYNNIYGTGSTEGSPQHINPEAPPFSARGVSRLRWYHEGRALKVAEVRRSLGRNGSCCSNSFKKDRNGKNKKTTEILTMCFFVLSFSIFLLGCCILIVLL